MTVTIPLAFGAVLLGVRGRALTCPGREVQSYAYRVATCEWSARKAEYDALDVAKRRKDGEHRTDSDRGRLRDRTGAD